jgi:hypothetical protein
MDDPVRRYHDKCRVKLAADGSVFFLPILSHGLRLKGECGRISGMLCRMGFPPFQPPWWLRNPHLQTVVAARKPRRWSYGWKSWEPMLVNLGPDGNILAEASWQDGPRESSPALFLLHGLEGSAQSHHLLGISRKAFAAGFHTIRVNMRNCGGTEQLTPTLYCAGLSQDVFAVVSALREKCGISRTYGAGVSLGANVLLKFLGERGNEAARLIQGAAAVSTPIDLALGARAIGAPANRLYERHFVRQLVARMERKAAFFDGMADLTRIRRIRSIYEFDEVVTAPHFGFGSAEDYYRLASAGPLLSGIRVPTLLVQSMDDPLIPFESYTNPAIAENPFLVLLKTEHGGHAGFLGARPASGLDRDCYWAECRVVQFLADLAF